MKSEQNRCNKRFQRQLIFKILLKERKKFLKIKVSTTVTQ